MGEARRRGSYAERKANPKTPVEIYRDRAMSMALTYGLLNRLLGVPKDLKRRSPALERRADGAQTMEHSNDSAPVKIDLSKPFDKLGHADLIALTEAQINFYIDRECAEAGVPLLPPTAPQQPEIEQFPEAIAWLRDRLVEITRKPASREVW